MKKVIILLCVILQTSCNTKVKNAELKQTHLPIIGTWKLITGTIIKGADTTVTDYTKNQDVLKIISNTHFAFLRHDLGKDSTKIFVAGGGRCKIGSQTYREYLDFCNYRAWEHNTFEFEYQITGDTLITVGIENIDDLNINHLNIEKFIKVK